MSCATYERHAMVPVEISDADTSAAHCNTRPPEQEQKLGGGKRVKGITKYLSCHETEKLNST